MFRTLSSVCIYCLEWFGQEKEKMAFKFKRVVDQKVTSAELSRDQGQKLFFLLVATC